MMFYRINDSRNPRVAIHVTSSKSVMPVSGAERVLVQIFPTNCLDQFPEVPTTQRTRPVKDASEAPGTS